MSDELKSIQNYVLAIEKKLALGDAVSFPWSSLWQLGSLAMSLHRLGSLAWHHGLRGLLDAPAAPGSR